MNTNVKIRDMNKKEFLNKAEDTNVKINFDVPMTTFTTTNDNLMRKFEMTNGESCAVHPESFDEFSKALADDGTLPSDWKVSNSGMLNNFKRTTGGKIWDQA